MKLLWVILLLVVAAGATLVVLPARSPTSPAASTPGARGEPQRPRSTDPVPAPAPPSTAAPGPVASPASGPQVPAPASTGSTTGEAKSPEVKAPDAATTAMPPTETPPQKKPDEPKTAPPAPAPAQPPAPPSDPVPTPSTTAKDPEAVVLPEHPVYKGDKVMPSKAERKPDGTLVLDGRFGLKGSGTAADPYLVSWDLLLSAHETYKPRMGQTKIPQRIAMLDGKHVVISGFTAFPLTATDPKDMLMMLNQWDGCCIGVPPTPYDAIEVKLASNPTEKMKTADHGTMRGRFKLDPYEDGGWLLGLYLLEEAKFDPGKEGGSPDAPLP